QPMWKFPTSAAIRAASRGGAGSFVPVCCFSCIVVFAAGAGGHLKGVWGGVSLHLVLLVAFLGGDHGSPSHHRRAPPPLQHPPLSGSKMPALPLMIARLLTDELLILYNVPRLADVSLLERILGNHGVDIMVSGKRPGETADHGQTLHISASRIVDTTAPYELVSKMRASFWVLAPLIARMGEARVSMPGGCAIGTRPVDLLIMAIARL